MIAADSEIKPRKIYHEEQSLLNCGLHTINNILQEPCYTKKDLENICKELHKGKSIFSINPHKSVLGLGDFDINVLIVALMRKDLDMVWYDARKPVEEIYLKDQNLIGLVINWSGKKSFWDKFLPSTNHWYAIRKLDDIYYNLDSRLSKQETFKSYEDVYRHLNAIKKDNAHIFLIRKSMKEKMIEQNTE